MARLMNMAALVGVALGIVIGAYAHSGNGFQTGTLIVLALGLSGLGVIVTGILALVGKRGRQVAAMGAFSMAMLVTLFVLPLVWPYPTSSGPQPLDEQPRSAQPQ